MKKPAHAEVLRISFWRSFSNVNHAGQVTLCCNDVYYENIMGDITQNSIREVWSSTAFQNVRRKFLNKDRNHGICARCDTVNNLCGSIDLLDNNQVSRPAVL